MNKILIACVSIIAVLTLGGCVLKEPEGPAEQIGKGIDQMSQGLQKLDRDRAENQEKSPNYNRDTYRGDPTINDDQVPSPEDWESYEDWQRRKGYR